MKRIIDMPLDFSFSILLNPIIIIIKFFFSAIALLLIVRSVCTKISNVSLYIFFKPLYLFTDVFVKPINMIMPRYCWQENPYVPLFTAIIIIFLGLGLLSFFKIVFVN